MAMTTTAVVRSVLLDVKEECNQSTQYEKGDGYFLQHEMEEMEQVDSKWLKGKKNNWDLSQQTGNFDLNNWF